MPKGAHNLKWAGPCPDHEKYKDSCKHCRAVYARKRYVCRPDLAPSVRRTYTQQGYEIFQLNWRPPCLR